MATNKFLRRERARCCPIHTAVLSEAADRLAHSGVFSKDEIVTALRYEVIEDAIRWDYIREFLESDHDCTLVPLAGAYFKRHRLAEEFANTARFIAMGHGKKTAGYAAVTPENSHLVVCRIGQRRELVRGAHTAYKNFVTKAVTKCPERITPEGRLISS